MAMPALTSRFPPGCGPRELRAGQGRGGGEGRARPYRRQGRNGITQTRPPTLLRLTQTKTRRDLGGSALPLMQLEAR